MISLTKKTDYALIALTHLARNGGEVCTAREIAAKFQVPAALLMNVLKTLCQGELVRSIRGARGGYSLAKAPEQISLADIITVVDGPIRFTQCSGSEESHKAPCDLNDTCPVKLPVQRIHARLEQFFRQISLADMVRDATDPRPCVPLSVGGEILTKPGGCCGGTSANVGGSHPCA